MEVELLRFPNKALRAQVIKEYMKEYGFDKAVCFSCGNASRELKLAGVDTLDISVSGDLLANRWFTMGEIKKAFPEYFDATSGHLPWECMMRIAQKYKEYFKELPAVVNLPTGSGETLVCLKMAFPETEIIPIYNIDTATLYEPGAPLNSLVKIICKK